jgi:hypothetical protein
MNSTFITSDFLREFSWSTFTKFVPVSFSLIGLLATLAITMHFLEASRGGTEFSLFDIFFRAVVAILLLTTFQTIIEGAKDFVWSIESGIQEKGSIEGALSQFQHELSSGKFWDGNFGALKAKIAGWSLWACAFVKNCIFLLYQVLWVVGIVLGPFVIPTFVLPFMAKIFRWYGFFLLALLLVRIPWAGVSAVVAELVRFLSTQGSKHEIQAFLLFWASVLITGLTPILSVLALLKSDAVLGHVASGIRGAAGGGARAASLAWGGGKASAAAGSWITGKITKGREMQKLGKSIRAESLSRGMSTEHTNETLKSADTLQKRQKLQKEVLSKAKLCFLLALLPLSLYAGQQCEIHASSHSVTPIHIPLGAATTLELPFDFKFAIPGNPIEFEVQPVPADSKMVVVVAKKSLTKTTSLTIGMKDGKPLSFWLIPVDRNSGCVYAKIRRVL